MNKPTKSPDSSVLAGESGSQIIYVLERFPGGTLNFVYNEIRELEKLGLQVDIFSILPSNDVPSEAKSFVERTQTIRPVSAIRVVWAWVYYLVTKPAAMAVLLGSFPFENDSGRWLKAVKTFGHLFYSVYFAWLIRDKDQHVHAHFAFKAATAAYVVSKLNGNSFSFTSHGSATVYEANRYSLRSKIRHARFVVPVSEYNRMSMQTLCPDVSFSKYFVNRTGVLLDQFPFAQREGGGTLGAVPRIVCVATLYPIKNHEALVRAVGVLVDAGKDCHLDLVGKDEVGIGSRLRKIASELGIAEKITFHGAVDHCDVVALLQHADVAVLTSISEGIPVSLMEAMAVGVPVVGPRVTGVPELIEDGVSGFLINPNSVVEIAETIRKVLDGKADCGPIIENGRRKIENEFDMKNNAKRLARFFHEQLEELE